MIKLLNQFKTSRTITTGLFATFAISSPLSSFAMGSKSPIKAPSPQPPQNVAIPDTYFTSVQAQGFSFQPIKGLGLSPTCLKNSGIKLLILDAGHDDSSRSIRSDAKVRGGDGRYVILWPEVHEGQLNFTTAYLTYAYILGNPALSNAQRNELQSMIRFTRLPGESKFGQYESEDGYGSIGGTITQGIENRANRINSMMANHRPYDSSRGSYSRSVKNDLRTETLFVSVHANSSDYYDEGDHTWVIPPKTQSRPTEISRYLASFQEGFSSRLSDLLEVKGGDTSQEASLKRGAQSSTQRGNIRISKHSTNLTVLSTQVSTPYKFLTEGFVMNGKVGHLAYLEMTKDASKKLLFKRGSRNVTSYDVTDVYLHYAQSIVESLQNQFDCKF